MKKIIPIIALASVLGIGVSSLSSCSTEDVKEVIGTKHGIGAVNEDGLTITLSTTEALAGETITVDVSLTAEGATLKGINLGDDITPTKVTDTQWTFIMPDRSVIVRADVTRPAIPPVEIHHYGVELSSTRDVTLTTEADEAIVGDTIIVTAKVTNPAISLLGLVAEDDVTIVPVENEPGKYSFVMPGHVVHVSAITEAIEFGITLPSDQTKGTIEVQTPAGTAVTKAGAGTDLVIKHTTVDQKFMPATIKVNDQVVDYDAEIGGYPFKMPAKAATISVIYKDAKFELKLTSNYDIFNNIELIWGFDEAAMIYNLLDGETLLTETFAGSNIYADIVPGTALDLTTSYDSLNLTGGHILKSVTLNEDPITFETQDLGLGSKMYMFDSPTFLMPAKDSELHFEFALPETISITNNIMPGAELSLIDLDSGSSSQAPTTVVKGSDLMYNLFIEDGYVLDYSTSGIYKADGTLAGEFMEGEFGITATVNMVNEPLTVVVNTLTVVEAQGISGNWVALEAINDSAYHKNGLNIFNDGSFEFFFNGAVAAGIKGTLTSDGAGSFTYENSEYELTLTPRFEEVDGSLELRWLELTQTKISNGTSTYFVFSKGTFTSIDKASVKKVGDNGTIAYVSLDGANFGSWMLADKVGGLRPVTFTDGPRGDEYYETNKIYPLVDGETTTELQYKSGKLNYPSKERGEYSDGTDLPVILDGFNNYKQGTLTGTYTLENSLLTLTPAEGEKTKWDVNFETKTLTTHIPTKNTISDVSYTFIATDNDPDYPSNDKVEMSFVNSDEFSIKVNGYEKGKSYLLEDNTLTVKGTKSPLVFNVNPTTLQLTVVSGYVTWMGDVTKGAKIAPKALAREFTNVDTSSTDKLVLGLDNQLQLGTAPKAAYTLTINAGGKLQAQAGDNIYELDPVANTFKDVTPVIELDFFEGKTYHADTMLNSFTPTYEPIEAKAEVDLTFAAKGTKTVDVKLTQHPESFGGDEVYEKAAAPYTVDSKARTISITLDDKTLTIAIDAVKQTLKTTQSSITLGGIEYGLSSGTFAEVKTETGLKDVLAGKAYTGKRSYMFQDYAEGTEFNVDIDVTITFNADASKAEVKLSETPLVQFGMGTDDVTRQDCAVTIDDSTKTVTIAVAEGNITLTLEADGTSFKCSTPKSSLKINGIDYGVKGTIIKTK